MKLKYTLEMIEIDGRSFAVPIGENADSFCSVIECNETAAVILEMLKKDISEKQIVTALEDRYEAPAGVIESRVRRFLNTLQEKGMLA